MTGLITKETLDTFCYSNIPHINGEVGGICVSFRGLGATAMISDDTEIAQLRPTVERAKKLADAGVVFFVPYLDPWNWLNDEAVATTDAIIDAIIRALSLPNDIPIVSSGGSMGGMCALTYMVYAKRTPIACVANCPVCDVPFHYTERNDLPRTFYHAYYNSNMPIEAALKAHSPLHLTDKMPDAHYYIFHCEQDRAVNIDAHSKKLVQALKKSRRVTFHTVENRGHCALTPEMSALYDEYIIRSCK